ncbi:MAG TPA: polymorphic toxin type 44 domain-containing protein [Candidatus Kapabacteria bacterium]|nr:polymorphic toxin type 44 domain-containing protein [Candidatus Kapabacteria bacterium]
MYSAGFADDSHLRSLGGHGSGGGGGGRSLGSTQGFGPKTYDPYNILHLKGNGVNVKAGFVVNKSGTKIRDNDDANDQNIYYRRDYGAIETLGKIGGTLNTNEIIANILDFNTFVAELESVVNLYRFFNKVKSKGDWDFKNRIKGESNIFGLLHGTGTLFSVSGYGYMDSEQFGNFHFGVISSAWGYSEHFAKWGAGIYQIISDTSPFMDSKSFTLLMSNSITLPLIIGWTLIPPHGDDYIDNHMIGVGYWYFKVSRGSK